jgi:glycosyltransferase 2 family protein
LLKSRGFWIGAVVSLITIGLFVRTMPPIGDVKDAFAQANYWLALGSLPVYFLALWVRTIRWQYLLRPVKKVRTWRLYPVLIIGLMANNLLPARAGELARAYVLGEREKISKSASFGTILVDRIFDGLTLAPMLLLVAIFAKGSTNFEIGVGPFKTTLNLLGLGLVMAGLFGTAIFVLFYLALSKRGKGILHNVIHRFAPAKLKPSVEGLLDSFLQGLQALRSPVDLAAAWIMSLLSWTLEATMYYMVARAFGIDEPFYVFLLLTAAANLVIALLATSGGVGPFELVVQRTIVAFAVAGRSDPSALASAYAVALHALLLVPIVAIGLALLWSMDLSLGDILQTRRTEQPVTPVSESPDDTSVAPSVRAAQSAVGRSACK